MSSIAPAAGGQYHWASEFAHPRVQRFTSYVADWLLTLSWLCGITSGMFLTGQMAQGVILITSENFDAHPWQVWLFVFAFCFVGALFNTVGAKHPALLEIVVAVFFVLGFAANIIVLWVMSPLNSASDVFGSFTNGDGWSNNGFGILTAQLASLYLLIGPAECPEGIIGSYLMGAGSGLVILVTFCFCFIPDDLTSGSTGFAFMAVYQRITGSNASAQVLTATIIILTFFSATNFMASASRQTYAFARDGGLPFHRYIAKVSDRFGVPVLAVVICFFFVILLSLIDLGSNVAFEAIISLQLIALFATYEVAIGTLIFRRLFGPPLPHRQWSLGRAGLWINSFAFIYGLFALAFIVLPSTPHVKPSTMNWAPVIFVGVMAFALMYFVAGGHKTYDGPVVIVKDRSDWGL